MSTTEAKDKLQAQLETQAPADQVTVDRKSLERVLQCIDDMRAWVRSVPQPSGGAV